MAHNDGDNMKVLYCWRCKMDVPMLDEQEFEIAEHLYQYGRKNIKVRDRVERYKLLLE